MKFRIVGETNGSPYQLKSQASGGLIGTRLTQLFALSDLMVGALTFGRPTARC